MAHGHNVNSKHKGMDGVMAAPGDKLWTSRLPFFDPLRQFFCFQPLVQWSNSTHPCHFSRAPSSCGSLIALPRASWLTELGLSRLTKEAATTHFPARSIQEGSLFSLALNLTSCSLPSHTRALKLWTLLLLPHKLFFTFLHFFLCLAFLLALIVYIILLILPPTINYDIAPFFNKARCPARLVDLWVLLTTSPFTRSDTYRYTRAQSRHPTARCLRSSKVVLKRSPSWAAIEVGPVFFSFSLAFSPSFFFVFLNLPLHSSSSC
jgi:hypothetical protein